MIDPRLSPELQQIERELAAQPREEPPLRLRARTLDGLRLELRRERSAFDRYLLAAAAALVWLNLALSATNAAWRPLDVPQPRELAEPLVRQIAQLLPELSPNDARRLALSYWAGSGVVPCPDVPSWPAIGQRRWGEEI